jgi:hypothetical protein
MHADAGDEIVVRGRHIGDEDRHDSIFMPSSDTVVEHRPAQGNTG